jgi:hypothetical protein
VAACSSIVERELAELAQLDLMFANLIDQSSTRPVSSSTPKPLGFVLPTLRAVIFCMHAILSIGGAAEVAPLIRGAGDRDGDEVSACCMWLIHV